MTITKDMSIGELLMMNKHITPILIKADMHYSGCPASTGESLEEACMVHGIDCDILLSQINEIIAED